MRKTNLSSRETELRMPLNLQFFAEGDPAGADDNTNPEDNDAGGEEGNNKDTGKDTDKPTKTYEDALAEIAAAQAEVKKAKAERDAALKKSGDLTKQLRAKMTEAELEAEKKQAEDEERTAYVKDLEHYKAENEARKRYRLQGMSDDLAEKAAKAEIEGDMDALADVQQQHTKALLKEKEAEWKASRPRVNMSDGEEGSMTKEEILAIKDTKERQEAIAKNISLFT